MLAQAAEAEAREDSLENDLIQTLEEINSNLERIKEKQGLITVGSPENLSRKQTILDNIAVINSLIDNNRRMNEKLNLQLRKIGKEKNALARLADQSKDRVAKQEVEIAELKSLLEKESFKVAELNRKVEELVSENAKVVAEREALSAGNTELDRNLNTAWFTYGTAAQLAERGLMVKQGGILGIGRKDVLTEAFHRNKALFTTVDVRELKEVPLHGRKPKLLTDHPNGSYELKKEENGYSLLVIREPNDFWSRSRYLVVEVQD
jgi:hypothetical protein